MLALHPLRPPLDFEQLGAIADGVVRRYRKLFAPFPDLGYDDLHQEGVIAGCAAHDFHDPARWMYATWIERAVRRHLLTLARTRRQEQPRRRPTA